MIGYLRKIYWNARKTSLKSFLTFSCKIQEILTYSKTNNIRKNVKSFCSFLGHSLFRYELSSSCRFLVCTGLVSTSVLISLVRCWSAVKMWAICLTTGTSERFTQRRWRMAPGSSTNFQTITDASTCWREESTVASQSGRQWTLMWVPSAVSRTFRPSLFS